MPTKQISKINYNGETYQIIDETISSTYAPIGHDHTMSDIADGVQGVYYVAGTQTGATGSWTGSLSTVSTLYNGLTIAYYLPQAGSGDASLTLDLQTSTTTAIPVYYTGTTRTTTHYPAGSVVMLTYVDGAWRRADYNTDTNSLGDTWCGTGSATAAKTATHTHYYLKEHNYTIVTLRYGNTAASALTLNINSTGDKPIYINGVPSSSTNYTLPRGTYLVYYDGTNYYFRTDNKITGNITGDATTVNGHQVLSDVPDSAKFTDTTYNFDGNSGFVTTGTSISLGTVPVAHGGTGTTSFAAGQVLIGDGTSAITTRGIDTTTGGTANSTSLITSGAVYNGLSAKADNGHSHTFSELGIATNGTYNDTTNPLATVSTVSTAVSAITASSLGLGQALRFIGFTVSGASGQMSDGQTTTPTISGKSSYTPAVGDVVIDHSSSFEYVYTTNNKWERFGPDGDFITTGVEIAFTPEGTISSTDAATGSNYTPKGTIASQIFHGDAGTINVLGTPTGTIQISSITPSGSISSTFTGSQDTITVSGTVETFTVHSTYTPVGSISTVSTATQGNNYTPYGTVTINNNNTITVSGTPGGQVTSAFTGSGITIAGAFSGTQGSVSVSGTTPSINTTKTPTYSALQMTVSNEVLSYSWVTADTDSSNKVLAAFNVEVEQFDFTASGSFTPAGSITITTTTTGTHNYTPGGTITSTFVGENSNFTQNVTATFSGTAAKFTFTGTQSQITSTAEGVGFEGSGAYTPRGSVTSTFTGTATTPTATFIGEQLQSSGSFTPTGTIDQAIFTGSGAKFTFTGSTTTASFVS